MRRRLLGLFFVFMLFIAALVGRLGWIQLASGGEYSRLAKEQSMFSLPEIAIRGTIYDRNNRPITNATEGFFFIIDERKMDEKAQALISGIGAESITSRNGMGKYRAFYVTEPDRDEFDKLCRDYNLLAVKHSLRYSANQPAKHVIGGLDKEGLSGLWGIEKDYDSVLSAGTSGFTIRCDGQGYYLNGKGINIAGDGRQWGVITTLDIDIQKAAENAFEKRGQKGAAVVTHIKSGEILASVSSNGYLQQENGIYDENSEAFLNKATAGMYPIGPVFYDIATAAGFSGLETGGVSIPAEKKGILITPMELARLMRIVASEGWDIELTLIKGTIEGVKGVFYLPKQQEKPIISAEAVRIIREMIEGEAGKEKIEDEGWCTGYVTKEKSLYGITVYVEDEDTEEKYGAEIFNEIADII